MRKNLVELLFAFVFVGGVSFWAYCVHSRNQDFRMTVNPATIGKEQPKESLDKDGLTKKQRESIDLWINMKPEPRVGPKFNFEPFDVDLRPYHYADKDLARMQKQDDEIFNAIRPETVSPSHKNSTWEYKTSVGTFTIITSYGRYSVNGKGLHTRPDQPERGDMKQSLCLPGGKCMRLYPDFLDPQTFFEVDGKVFLLGSTRILQWIDQNTLRNVVQLEGGNIQSWPGEHLTARKYFAVVTPSGAAFEGFLDYSDTGVWSFYPYAWRGGEPRGVKGSFRNDDGMIILKLGSLSIYAIERGARDITVQFDPMKKIFRDLP